MEYNQKPYFLEYMPWGYFKIVIRQKVGWGGALTQKLMGKIINICKKQQGFWKKNYKTRNISIRTLNA